MVLRAAVAVTIMSRRRHMVPIHTRAVTIGGLDYVAEASLNN